MPHFLSHWHIHLQISLLQFKVNIMAVDFLSDDFLLHSESARALYHDRARCAERGEERHAHLSPGRDADDARPGRHRRAGTRAVQEPHPAGLR